MLLTQYLAWALLNPAILAAPAGPTAIAFWLSQLGAVTVLGLTCVLGFTPPLVVACRANGLHLRRGKQALDLAFDDIEFVEIISALAFHRHWRRYAATHIFINRLDGEVLLLHTAHGPVALRLHPNDQEALHAHLAEQHEPIFAPATASAA